MCQREYHVRMPTDDYFAMLDMFAYGRLVRYRLGAGRWEEFRRTVAGKVVALGLNQIEYTSRRTRASEGYRRARLGCSRCGRRAEQATTYLALALVLRHESTPVRVWILPTQVDRSDDNQRAEENGREHHEPRGRY